MYLPETAADRRFMHADNFRYLDHRERFQKGHAFVHEIVLTFNNFLADVQDGGLPLVQALIRNFPARIFSRM